MIKKNKMTRFANIKKSDKKINGKPKNIKVLQLELKKAEEKIKQIQQDLEKYLNLWKRAEADFDNFKKSEQKRIDERLKVKTEKIILELIPILNNFERAAQFIPKELQDDNYIQGLFYIKKELKTILEQNGLKKIELKNKFDPNFHEIIEASSQDIKLEDKYKIEEIEAGYTFNDKVIKPIKIKIIQE